MCTWCVEGLSIPSIAVLQSPQPPDGKPPSASQQILLEGGSTPQEQAGTPEVEELHTAPAIGEFRNKRIHGWMLLHTWICCAGAEPHPPEPKSILTEMNDIMVSKNNKRLSQRIASLRCCACCCVMVQPKCSVQDCTEQ